MNVEAVLEAFDLGRTAGMSECMNECKHGKRCRCRGDTGKQRFKSSD